MNNLEHNLVKKVLKNESDDVKKVLHYELTHLKRNRGVAVKHGNLFFNISTTARRKLMKSIK